MATCTDPIHFEFEQLVRCFACDPQGYPGTCDCAQKPHQQSGHSRKEGASIELYFDSNGIEAPGGNLNRFATFRLEDKLQVKVVAQPGVGRGFFSAFKCGLVNERPLKASERFESGG